MATVYRATDVKHDRQVAVKVLRPELAATIGPERFLREIRIAAHLQHPHILPLLDSGEAEGFLYYVMPFIEGESLRARLNRDGELPVSDAARLLRDVADALAYAHTHGIVHRDIKPDNVLISDRHALVMDFGVAKAVSEAVGEHDITSAGVALGTPAYMAPEQAAGDPQVDGRADIYALGALAYELLTGEPPFSAGTLQGVLAAHVTESPRPITDLRPAVPASLAALVMRCLEKKPADRWQTADEMLPFLENLRTPETGMPPVSPVRVHERRRIARWGMAASVLVASLAGVGVWLSTHRPRPAAVPTDDPTHIAVLYFDDNTPGGGLDYLASGLTDALIHELAQVPALHVISRNGVRPYRQGTVTLDSIVRALQVGTLVAGSVARSGNRVRVSFEMLDAKGTTLESRTLERPWSELFALQDDLASEVSAMLRRRLGQEVQVRRERAAAHDVAAWEAYQQADEFRTDAQTLVAGGDTNGASRDLTQADSLLMEAERRDPRWVQPTILRGWLAADRALFVGGTRFSFLTDWNRRGIEIANRALSSDPANAEALELRGRLENRMAQDQEVDEGERDSMMVVAEADLRAAVGVQRIEHYTEHTHKDDRADQHDQVVQVQDIVGHRRHRRLEIEIIGRL